MRADEELLESLWYTEDFESDMCCEARECCEDGGACGRRDLGESVGGIFLRPLARNKLKRGCLLWCELCIRQSAAVKDKPEALQ